MKNLFKITKAKKTFLVYFFGIWIFVGSFIKYTMTEDTGYLIFPSIILLFLFADLFARYFNNSKNKK